MNSDVHNYFLVMTVIVSSQKVYVHLARGGKILKQSRLGVDVPENSTYDDLKTASFQKQLDYNPDLLPSTAQVDYELMYRSGKSARFIPGTQEPFILKKFREASGKVYSQIVFILDYFHMPDLGMYERLL